MKGTLLLCAGLISVFQPSCLSAQTGPGGVGTSATNVLWLDASRGVTVIGTEVDAWADQSGNSNNGAVPIASSRPGYVIPSLNNYPTFDFDGVNDEILVPDAASLDLTQWHFFMVAGVDLQKNYNAWMVKGNDGQENFEVLSYNDGNIHSPVYFTDGSRTSPSTAGGMVNTVSFNIIEYSFAPGLGRDIYRNVTSVYTDNESKTPALNNFELFIGNERGTAGRYLNGDIAELIAFNAPLNSTRRIIVNNYLSAKYNIALGGSDLYTMDNPANGNYDHDVSGIGRVSAGNLHNDSKGSGMVRMLNPSGLGNGEYLFWGHNNGLPVANNNTDVPAPVQTRFDRVWRLSEVGDVGNVDIHFDLAGLGAVTASDLRLLVDTDNDGTFADESPVAGATLISGTTYGFSSVSLFANNRRFTLGTINATLTPLPIELLSFQAVYTNGKVALSWQTASETNSDHFTLERSQDANVFEQVLQHPAAGNSSVMLNYAAEDLYPLEGTSYYRLKLSDSDGSYVYSAVIAVHASPETSDISVYPNPAASGSAIYLELGSPEGERMELSLRDIQGKEYFSAVITHTSSTELITIDPEQKLAAGTYIITARSEKRKLSRILLVK